MFYRYIKKQKLLFASEKPSNFPLNKTITEREWQSVLNKTSRKNPVIEGQKYFEYLDSNPDFKYQDVANEFGVSKARVSQMIALIRKLPQEIIDYFLNEDDVDVTRNITERKFRPLTLLDSDEEKIYRFMDMVKTE